MYTGNDYVSKILHNKWYEYPFFHLATIIKNIEIEHSYVANCLSHRQSYEKYFIACVKQAVCHWLYEGNFERKIICQELKRILWRVDWQHEWTEMRHCQNIIRQESPFVARNNPHDTQKSCSRRDAIYSV